MSIQEQAQAKIDEENLNRKITAAKHRLERIANKEKEITDLQKQIADLKEDLAKIENDTFDFGVDCFISSSTLTVNSLGNFYNSFIPK